MLPKLLLILLSVRAGCECVLYSSFWAPLFDRRILSYRVHAPFEPNAGKSAREQYANDYGIRGAKLIADLGNGKGPRHYSKDDKVYGDVKFFYT